MSTISFFVEGEPRPQGSKTPVVRGGRAFLIEGTGDAPRKHRAWRDAVRKAAEDFAEEVLFETIDGPVEVKLQFLLERPASRSKNLVWADRKPDIDKLVRAILDSISGQEGPLLREDSRVVKLTAEKHYVAKDEKIGCWINVHELEQSDTQLSLEL
jgi:crossover junction endodeoxyribonuclease RusA